MKLVDYIIELNIPKINNRIVAKQTTLMQDLRNTNEYLYYADPPDFFFNFEGKIFELTIKKIPMQETLYSIIFKQKGSDHEREIRHKDISSFFSIMASIIKQEFTKGTTFIFTGEKRRNEYHKKEGELTARDKMYLRILKNIPGIKVSEKSKEGITFTI
jgi:hypothetical protein